LIPKFAISLPNALSRSALILHLPRLIQSAVCVQKYQHVYHSTKLFVDITCRKLIPRIHSCCIPGLYIYNRSMSETRQPLFQSFHKQFRCFPSVLTSRNQITAMSALRQRKTKDFASRHQFIAAWHLARHCPVAWRFRYKTSTRRNAHLVPGISCASDEHHVTDIPVPSSIQRWSPRLRI
jgi:hypothetical protein